MSHAGLEAVLEKLRRARGLDLSDYRRATLERRPGDLYAYNADTGVPLLVEEMVKRGARPDRLQATMVGGPGYRRRRRSLLQDPAGVWKSELFLVNWVVPHGKY